MSKKNLVEKNFIRPSRFVPAVSSCAPGTGGQVNYFLNAKPKAKIVRRRSASSTSAVCFAKISQAVLNGKFDRQETVYRISLNRPTENLTENINRLKPASPSGLIFYLILLEIFFSTTIRGFGNPLFEIVKRLLKAVKASLVFELKLIRPSRFVPAVSSCAPGTGGQVNYFLNAKPKAKIVRRRSASSTSAVCFAKISQAVLNGKFDRQETVYRISLNRPTENLTENINRLKPASPSGLIFYLILLEIFFSTTIRGFGNPLFEIVKRLLKAVKASLVFELKPQAPRLKISRTF